jgi:CBS domain-containing protein
MQYGLNIGMISSRNVVHCDEQASMLEIAKMMREEHVGSVVVGSEVGGHRRPVGIITDRDLVVQVLAEEAPMDELTAADVMTSDPLCVHESTSVSDAIDAMRGRGVRRAIIVDDSNSLAGIASLDDLLLFFAAEFSGLVDLVETERKKELQLHSKP